jgi:hypothetical protein
MMAVITMLLLASSDRLMWRSVNRVKIVGNYLVTTALQTLILPVKMWQVANALTDKSNIRSDETYRTLSSLWHITTKQLQYLILSDLARVSYGYYLVMFLDFTFPVHIDL